MRGTVRAGSQKHFYMETQCAYALPDEEGQVAARGAPRGGALASSPAGTPRSSNAPLFLYSYSYICMLLCFYVCYIPISTSPCHSYIPTGGRKTPVPATPPCFYRNP